MNSRKPATHERWITDKADISDKYSNTDIRPEGNGSGDCAGYGIESATGKGDIGMGAGSALNRGYGGGFDKLGITEYRHCVGIGSGS